MHLDFSANDNCYALAWSYGEICVGCGCCSEDPAVSTPARIQYHEEMLAYFEGLFAEGDRDEHVKKSIERHKKAIQGYKEMEDELHGSKEM